MKTDKTVDDAAGSGADEAEEASEARPVEADTATGEATLDDAPQPGETEPTQEPATATDEPVDPVAPVSEAPETDVPETDVPESDVPETDVPETGVPETDVAVTPEPYEPAPDEPAVGEAPVSEAPPDISEAPPDITDDDAPLLDGQRWKDRWDRIQIRFVDDPRQAIEDADALVDDVVTEVAAKLADERARLESQWNGGSEPSTEDLRQALQRYRRFLTRLLAA